MSPEANSQNDPGIIPIFTNDLQAILSQNTATDASELDYIEYWRGLEQMSATSQIFEEACNWCNASEQLRIPAEVLSFEANCTLIGGFYSRYYGSGDLTMDYADLVPFLTASLPSLYQNTTPTTIEAIAASIWNYSTPYKPLKTPVLPFKKPYATLALDAAASCAKEACQDLDYSGNTNLGGVGSLATYFMIAAITTVFAILSIHYQKHRDFKWQFRNDLRDNVITTSIMFWDAVTWLAILTLVAALVVYILLNSVGALWTLEAYHGPSPRDLASIPQYIARIIITGITWFVALGSLYAVVHRITSWIQKYDSACYAERLWPLYRAWIVATWFQVFIPVLWAFVWIVKKVFVHKDGLSRHPSAHKFQKVISEKLADRINLVLAYLSAVLSLCVLWFDVVCIYMFRLDARDYFGESYDDDSFGYGQMLAAGFAIQPVINFLFFLFCNFCSTPTAHDNFRSHLAPWLADRVWPIPKARLQKENSQRLEAKDRPESPPLNFGVGSGVYESSSQSGYSTEIVPLMVNMDRKAWGAGHRHNS